MLEKVRGQIDIFKLRVILLLESDFNTLNKLVFNMRLIPSLEYKKAIPYKIIGEKRDYLAIYIALNKKLVSDIVNQVKIPTIVISADATSCYNQIAHPIASISYQYFKLNLEYLLLFFGTIQLLKIFLRISFEVSSKFYTRIKELSF